MDDASALPHPSREPSLSVARTLAVALAAGLLSLGAVGAAVTQAASDDTQFFTWFASSGGHDALFTVVYDSAADDTFVLERDDLTGRVRARFGGGFIATGIAARSRSFEEPCFLGNSA